MELWLGPRKINIKCVWTYLYFLNFFVLCGFLCATHYHHLFHTMYRVAQNTLWALNLWLLFVLKGVRLRVWTVTTNELLVHPPDYIWVRRAMVEWYWQGYTKELREWNVPMPFTVLVTGWYHTRCPKHCDNFLIYCAFPIWVLIFPESPTTAFWK
jgi:hypothetical protein